MRFHQPVGVIPQNNDYISISINVNGPESRFLISSKATNNQLTRVNGNNFANVTENLNLTQLQSIVTAKQSENINNFDSSVDFNKTTTLDEILKFKNDSKYFKSYFGGQQTDTSNIDLENGNKGVILIETLSFTENSLSQVREICSSFIFRRALKALQNLLIKSFSSLEELPTELAEKSFRNFNANPIYFYCRKIRISS